MEIDPVIAEAMGFTGFGAKKRKHGATGDESFVDPALNKQAKAIGPQGKGSNSIPLGNRGPSNPVASRRSGGEADESQGATGTLGDGDGDADLRESSIGQLPNEQSEASSLQALRHGVKNERDDMVYFLPSFLEDPWKDLRST